MNIHQQNNFLFSSKLLLLRHTAFWVLEILLIAFAWSGTYPFWECVLVQFIWLPVYMVYCYPFIYWVIPQVLLKGKYVQFGVVALLWILAGWFVNYYFRLFVMIPFKDLLGMTGIGRNPGQQGNLFSLIAVWCFVCTLTLFKHWLKKQHEWLKSERKSNRRIAVTKSPGTSAFPI